MGQKFYTDMDLNDVRIIRVAAGTTDTDGVNKGQVGTAIASGITQHEAKPDPHPQYATDADLAAHSAAVDPHPVYLTKAEADALYATPVEEVIVGTTMPTDPATNLWVNTMTTGTEMTTDTFEARLSRLEDDVARILAMLEERKA